MQSPGTLRDMLVAAVARDAGAPALIDDAGNVTTFAALLARADAVAAALHARGVRRDERIAIVLPNGVPMATAFLGAAFAGVACPLNPAYRRAEFAFYLDDLHARTLITTGSMDGPASAVARSHGIRVVDIDELRGRAAPDFAPPRPLDTALILHTSGTTSKPKIVPLTQANLRASAANIAATLALTPADRCLGVMPLFHIHGLAGALLSSLSAGAALVCTGGFVSTEFFAQLRAHRPTWYTAVPTMHQAIVARAAVEAVPTPLRFVRSSSSALAPSTAGALEDVFAAPVIEAYGMTEAAHQMCSNPLGRQRQRYGSVGPAAGPEVTILDESGAGVPPGAVGEVAIRGASVTAGYAGNGAANADAFVRGWFRTGDLGRFDADGYLYLVGRIKEIINRGGEKIAPREVDEVLLGHPGVAQAVTFAIPDDRLGEEVGAAVVLAAGARCDEASILAFVAERLTDFKVPRRIVILDELPKGPTGKLVRIGLAGMLGLDRPARVSAAQAALDGGEAVEFTALLRAIWCEVLRVETVADDADFLALGGDSVSAAQVIARLRARCGRELSIAEFFDRTTLESMAVAVAEAPASEAVEDPQFEPAPAP